MTDTQIARTQTNNGLAAYAVGADWTRLAEEWLTNFRSARTRATYAAAWRDFFKWRGSADSPASVTRLDVIEYRDSLAGSNKSGATIGVRLAALASFFDYATANGAIRTNPAANVERPKVEAYRAAKWLNAKEAAELLRAPDRETLEGARDYAILLAMLTMGLRRAEVIGITRADLVANSERAELRYSPKGGEDKTRPVPAQVWKAIQDYLNARGELAEGAPVFVAHDKAANVGGVRTGRALTGQAVYYIVAKHSLAALGRVVNPHALRHTCAGTAWDSTRDLRRVQHLLGHASATTTEHYLHRRDDTRGELGEALAAIYEAN